MLNKYYDLSDADVANDMHRHAVGALWDTMGKMQMEFMLLSGSLQKHHKLLDLGCGSFRGGVHYVDYLDKNNYYGHDVSQALIDTGYEKEIVDNGLGDKFTLDNVSINPFFDFDKFSGVEFDRVVSISLFSHLPKKHFVMALKRLYKHLNLKSEVYISFFLVNDRGYGGPYIHLGGSGVKTYPDQDPFHYTWGQVQSVAKLAGYNVEMCEDPKFPRGQLIAKFSVR